MKGGRHHGPLPYGFGDQDEMVRFSYDGTTHYCSIRLQRHSPLTFHLLHNRLVKSLLKRRHLISTFSRENSALKLYNRLHIGVVFERGAAAIFAILNQIEHALRDVLGGQRGCVAQGPLGHFIRAICPEWCFDDTLKKELLASSLSANLLNQRTQDRYTRP